MNHTCYNASMALVQEAKKHGMRIGAPKWVEITDLSSASAVCDQLRYAFNLCCSAA